MRTWTTEVEAPTMPNVAASLVGAKTPFTSLLGLMAPEGDTYSIVSPEDWRQGRTAYGGLSAALCYEAAQRMVPGLPPLRSAQFAFVGPATGTLQIRPSVLRRGRSAAFVGVDVVGDAGMAVRGLLCFGEGRRSVIDHPAVRAPAVKAWDECPDLFEDSPWRPVSSLNFDARLADGARPRSPGEEPFICAWLRHRDAAAKDSIPALIALADVLPAAAMVMFPEPAAMSTMTWTLDMLTDAPASGSGWWLAASAAEMAREGYSAQNMTLWDDRGAPVIAMRQSVAIFI